MTERSIADQIEFVEREAAWQDDRGKRTRSQMWKQQHQKNAELFRSIAETLKQCESRSPDGDGLPMVKGLRDGASLTSNQGGVLPQQVGVHARQTLLGESSLKSADGSEPSDSLSTEIEAIRLRAYRQARIFEPSMEGYGAAMSVYHAAFPDALIDGPAALHIGHAESLSQRAEVGPRPDPAPWQALIEAAKHAVMEWRLHGQLTDSCRVLEAALVAFPVPPERP